MQRYCIDVDTSDPSTIELPQRLLQQGGRYSVEVKDGDVTIWGNSLGLLYLGEVLIRAALGGHPPTLHVHIPQDGSVLRRGPSTTVEPELTVFAADPEFGPEK